MNRTSSLAVLALLAATVMGTANASAAEKFDTDPKLQLPKPDGKPAAHSKPVMVYVMLGPSNMLGFGRVGPKETNGSLEFMVKEQGKYSHLADDAGNWTTRQDVRYVHVMDQRGDGYKDVANVWDKGTEPKRVPWYAGRQYDADTAHAKAVLKILERYYPGCKGQGYEVAGFVWWQGHKDQSAALASRYEQNLVQLIKTLRKDFDSPNAKFVLATGCGNPGREGVVLQIAEAQLAVDGDNGKHQEFKGNVKAVDTRDLWREADVSPLNQGHHYNHNAETCYETGDALGRAMATMLKETK